MRVKDDRRKHRRQPILLRVYYVNRGALAEDLMTDLSPGGLCLHPAEPLAVGAEVSIEVTVAEDPPIYVNGRVVWRRESGTGVQFTGVIGPLLLELIGDLRRRSG
jgi:Tfp pilus assembly protein PilZ